MRKGAFLLGMYQKRGSTAETSRVKYELQTTHSVSVLAVYYKDCAAAPISIINWPTATTPTTTRAAAVHCSAPLPARPSWLLLARPGLRPRPAADCCESLAELRVRGS